MACDKCACVGENRVAEYLTWEQLGQSRAHGTAPDIFPGRSPTFHGCLLMGPHALQIMPEALTAPWPWVPTPRVQVLVSACLAWPGLAWLCPECSLRRLFVQLYQPQTSACSFQPEYRGWVWRSHIVGYILPDLASFPPRACTNGTSPHSPS